MAKKKATKKKPAEKGKRKKAAEQPPGEYEVLDVQCDPPKWEKGKKTVTSSQPRWPVSISGARSPIVVIANLNEALQEFELYSGPNYFRVDLNAKYAAPLLWSLAQVITSLGSDKDGSIREMMRFTRAAAVSIVLYKSSVSSRPAGEGLELSWTQFEVSLQASEFSDAMPGKTGTRMRLSQKRVTVVDPLHGQDAFQGLGTPRESPFSSVRTATVTEGPILTLTTCPDTYRDLLGAVLAACSVANGLADEKEKKSIKKYEVKVTPAN